ncbi:MAG: metal-dependent transcriptional regulator [Candidatus Bathyarchaeota archaeon]|nr:metal-dependent transcriptional regulator [Candidatus Termiticorpusculum sp.]
MIQKSTQDYLKVVYSLSKNGEVVNNTDISQKLGVAPDSVTEMLKKLSDEGYIKYSPYHGSTLTEKGVKEAQKVTRKHRLLEGFLSNVLHIGNDRVHLEACQMEHALSDEAEESLCRFLKHPGTCPDDGKIIPACDLPFSSCEECIQLHQKGLEQIGRRDKNLISIRELKTGKFGKISFIRGVSIRYFNDF